LDSKLVYRVVFRFGSGFNDIHDVEMHVGSGGLALLRLLHRFDS
jgi:hypothetical protein